MRRVLKKRLATLGFPMKPVFQFKPQPGTLAGESINAELTEHALGAQWRHNEAIALFHEWVARFNREFKLGLELPAIAIDRMPVRICGTYRPGRNGLGLKHEIRLNERYLTAPLAQVLSTIL